MRLSDFDYTLPKELVAQYPSKKRGDDRLLVLDRANKTFEEKGFKDIVGYFEQGDILVLNDTRVIPARLFGRRKTGGRVEIFIIDKAKRPVEALVRPSGRIKEGESVILESGDEAVVLGQTEIGRRVDFKRDVEEILKKHGHIPLPPYIARIDTPADKERYQTVYAKNEGATASPTAGLHFTEDIICKIKEKGVKVAFVTLHVSYGTFAPIKEEIVERHRMHSEFFSISAENVALISDAHRQRRRIFACGTTVLRTLETCAERGFENAEGFTDLFIYPGYKFKIVNALITNFHLPRSTLILLTSAFAGKKLLFEAYSYAVKNKFRFFSYGDCMLII